MSTKGEFTMMASGTRLQAGSGLLPGLPGNLLLGNVKSAEILGFIFFLIIFPITLPVMYVDKGKRTESVGI